MPQVQFDDQGDGRIKVKGRLNFDTVTDALEASEKLFADHDALDLDLGEVDSSDSAGLALLVEWVAIARRTGCKLVFHRVPEQVLALARISEVEPLLPLK